MMQKRGSWSTAIGLIVAAFLMVPGLAPAAEPPPGKSDQDLEMAPGECPDSAGNTFLASYCNKQCKKREGCPAWSPIDAVAGK